MTTISFSISLTGTATDAAPVKDAFAALVTAIGGDSPAGALTLSETEVVNASDVLAASAPQVDPSAAPAALDA